MVLEIEGLNYIWSITCPTCPCDMFDMFLWYVRHVPLVCSTCSFDMFSMFLQYVQHAHNTCSSCQNYMYLHVLPHVPCSMCMFFSGGPYWCRRARPLRADTSSSSLVKNSQVVLCTSLLLYTVRSRYTLTLPCKVQCNTCEGL